MREKQSGRSNDPDIVPSSGDSEGWSGVARQTGILTGSLAPSEANIDNTSECHFDPSSVQGNESVDWEISNYTCSSLMREIIKI